MVILSQFLFLWRTRCWPVAASSVLTTPHPQSLSPLRGEGSSAPRRRERGSALLIVLVLLFTMTVLVLTTGRTLSTLQRELSLIDQKQQKKFQTGQAAEIKPKKPHAQ